MTEKEINILPQKNKESLIIEQNNKRYVLILENTAESITFSLSSKEEVESPTYKRKMKINEIKGIHNYFRGISSCQQLSDFIKKLLFLKKISIIKKQRGLTISFTIEYFFEKYIIEIDLLPENDNSNKSIIMKEEEFDLIRFAIKSRMNKEVKKLQKLYQASSDGDKAIDFHQKCDNIPNTLVIIKSAGKRRFGGFTSQCWESTEKMIWNHDENVFLFSLDNQKIFTYNGNGFGICKYKGYGPCFGGGFTIMVGDKSIVSRNSYTYESYVESSFIFNNEINALSEDGNSSKIVLDDYEVFQVLFS